MKSADDPNLALVRLVANRLGPLRERVVFVGGAATGLLITDPAAEAIRPTDDVDVIIEVGSLGEYHVGLRGELLARGFREDTGEGAPICRWIVDGAKVDIMPTDPSVLGFSNEWYAPAVREAVPLRLPRGPTIRVVSGPYFLATKIEAFRNRGAGDFVASHDLEDLIAVVDGRAGLAEEVERAGEPLRLHLATAIGGLLDDRDFQDALPGHLRGDAASQARLPRLLKTLARIARRDE